MKDIIEYLVNSIVSFPERVQINEIQENNINTLEIMVDSEDIGKIIGKQGRVIKAIRTIAKAAAIKDDKRIMIKIIN